MMKNRLFRNTCMLAALSVAAASCADDEFAKGGKLSDGAIGFGTSAVTAGDGSPLSRAVHYGDTPLVLLDKSGNDTLYLHTSTERNLSTVTGEKQATRGVPVNDDNFSKVCKSFGVTALTPDGQTLMDDEEIGDYSGGVWLPEETRYWPSDKMEIDFYAYAPYYYNDKKMFGEGGATKVNISDRSIIEFSYIVPLSIDRTDDASAQPDIMFCHKACSKNGVDPETGAVPLHFQHALAGVRFVAGDISKCTVKTITIENVYGEGSCVYAFDDGDGTFTWKTSGDATSFFCQTFNVAVADSQTGEQQITDKNPVTTFMMIPQELSENAGIKVELLMPDGTTETLTGSLNGQNWEAGNIYTYKISTESINWEYVFEVRASGTSNPATITMPLGGTTGKYEVISYRRRVQTNEIQPLKWSAAENSAKETNMESGAVSDINFDDVVTDFTSSGDGGKDASSYNIVIDRARMHTNYDGDEILQNAALVGSSENPYDLSLANGYSGSRNTANCYIVSAAGTYKLPLVYGNAIKNGGTNTSAYQGYGFKDYLNNDITGPYIYSSYTPKDCILVWSDGFYMFKDVKLSADKQFLEFTLDQEYMQQANAIVAVRDNQGRIMWSWHIWVTEHNLNDCIGLQDNTSGATNAYWLMRYNLGWVDGKMVYYNQRDLSYTFTQDVSGRTAVLNIKQEGDALDYKDVGSTYYQWGRKDPIVALRNRNAVGSGDYRPHETVDSKYGYKYVSKQVTLGESIQNPNIFYVSAGSTQWLTPFNYRLWDTSAPTYNAGVERNSSVKSIYDPSPYGFKIPPARAFGVLVNGYSASGNSGGTLNGFIEAAPNDFKYHVYSRKNRGGEEITLTATGQRVDRSSLGDLGGLWAMYGVYYWSCNANSAGIAYSMCIRKDSETNIYTIGFMGSQTMARPVRCIKE